MPGARRRSADARALGQALPLTAARLPILLDLLDEASASGPARAAGAGVRAGGRSSGGADRRPARARLRSFETRGARDLGTVVSAAGWGPGGTSVLGQTVRAHDQCPLRGVRPPGGRLQAIPRVLRTRAASPSCGARRSAVQAMLDRGARRGGRRGTDSDSALRPAR